MISLSKAKVIVGAIGGTEISRALFDKLEGSWGHIEEDINHTAFENGEIEALLAYVGHVGFDHALATFEETYEGTFESESCFSAYVCNQGMVDEIPASAYGYVDFDALAEFLFTSRYVFLLDDFGFGHVFKSEA